MTSPPPHPKIYHITHVDNLPAILAEGALLSDAAMIARGAPIAAIGMSSIKRRRLTLPVHSHPGDHVGDYVPFYFCPRSIMLFLIHKRNHEDLAYLGGQEPILHLEADLHRVVAWAEANNRRWAFTLSNAGSYDFEDRAELTSLEEIHWNAVHAVDWRNHTRYKQAEFLLEERLPWTLIDRIGVYSMPFQQQVLSILEEGEHKPPVEIIPAWYY